MKASLSFILVIALGCSTPSRPTSARIKSPPNLRPAGTNAVLYTPVVPVTGKIVLVNATARYVIISLAPGLFPSRETKLFAYRNGYKQAVLKVTGPQQDDKVVADILTGSVQVNDTVNDN